jgi:deoxyhypusine synthase
VKTSNLKEYFMFTNQHVSVAASVIRGISTVKSSVMTSVARALSVSGLKKLIQHAVREHYGKYPIIKYSVCE